MVKDLEINNNNFNKESKEQNIVKYEEKNYEKRIDEIIQSYPNIYFDIKNIEDYRNIENKKGKYINNLLEKNSFKKLNTIEQTKYIALYTALLDLSEKKQRDELTNNEKQFIQDFEYLSQSLGISYELPAFKESTESQNFPKTAADIVHQPERIINNDNYLQNYLHNLPKSDKITEKLRTKIQKNPEQKDKIEQRLMQQIVIQSDDRQKFIDLLPTNYIDPETKDINRESIPEPDYTAIQEIRNKFLNQAIQHIDKHIDQTQTDIQKNNLSFCIQNFIKLFHTFSRYNKDHLTQDFILDRSQTGANENNILTLQGNIGSKSLGLHYNIQDGTITIDNFLDFNDRENLYYLFNQDKKTQSTIMEGFIHPSQLQTDRFADEKVILNWLTDPTGQSLDDFFSTTKKQQAQHNQDKLRQIDRQQAQQNITNAIEKNTIIQDLVQTRIPQKIENDATATNSMNEKTKGMIDTNSENQITQLMQNRYTNTLEDPVPFGDSMRKLHESLTKPHTQTLPDYIKNRVKNTLRETKGETKQKRGMHINERLSLFVDSNNQLNHNDIQARTKGINNRQNIATIRAHMSEHARSIIDKRESETI